MQSTSLTPASAPSAPSAQQQGQKNEKIIKLGTDLITDLFITSTFIVPELQSRLRGVGKGGEDSIIIPQEPLLSHMRTSTFNSNSNSKKREEENLLTENKEEQLEEDSHNIEDHPLSKNELLIDNEHDDGGGGDVDHVYLDYDDGRKWEKNKDMFGNVIDACKVITDPPMEAKDYLLSNKAESWKENWNKKE